MSALSNVPRRYRTVLRIGPSSEKEEVFYGVSEDLIEQQADISWVRFTEGLEGRLILWCHDEIVGVDEGWLGWMIKPTKFVDGRTLWFIENNPHHPDYTLETPRNWNEFPDPAYRNVSLEKFIELVSVVFRLDNRVETPEEFARAMAGSRYREGYVNPHFLAIRTYQNKWGFAYRTTSGRLLIWLPWNVMYTKGMNHSKNFRSLVEKQLGCEAANLPGLKFLGATDIHIMVYPDCPTERLNRFLATISREPNEA